MLFASDSQMHRLWGRFINYGVDLVGIEVVLLHTFPNSERQLIIQSKLKTLSPPKY